MRRTLRVALVGGGLGGLTCALALTRRGSEAHIFEQADELKEIGAGVSVSPNGVKVLRALELEDALVARGFESEAIVGRDWTTGRTSFRVPLKEATAARFGAGHFDIHRADLLDILAAAGRGSRIHLGNRCVGVDSSGRSAALTLSNGRQEEFDVIVGCDGIRSSVRAALHGPDGPRFTGYMCWRALIPTNRLPPGHVAPTVTLWMGHGGHIVTFYVRGGALVNVVAVREVTEWVDESWSVAAQRSEILDAYHDVHEDLHAVLEQAECCFKWGLFDRDPLPKWSKKRITLLGDAAHPMLPFLGQGASMAMEDGYVLARELARSPDNIPTALRVYEAERVPRTARVQLAVREQGRAFHRASLGNRPELFLERSGEDSARSVESKTEWLYRYDATCERA